MTDRRVGPGGDRRPPESCVLAGGGYHGEKSRDWRLGFPQTAGKTAKNAVLAGKRRNPCVLRQRRSASLLKTPATCGLIAPSCDGVVNEGVLEGVSSRCRTAACQEVEESDVRGVLLRTPWPVRAGARRAMPDVPARPSRRPAAAEPAALRVPPGAPAPGRLGVP